MPSLPPCPCSASTRFLQTIRAAEVDLLVLGDCRIIRPHVLRLPRLGVLNSHPGLLPHMRGNQCSLWAVVHELPIGCSVHFCDEGIDTGPLIDTRRLRLDWQNTSYSALLRHLNEVCADMVRLPTPLLRAASAWHASCGSVVK